MYGFRHVLIDLVSFSLKNKVPIHKLDANEDTPFMLKLMLQFLGVSPQYQY